MFCVYPFFFVVVLAESPRLDGKRFWELFKFLVHIDFPRKAKISESKDICESRDERLRQRPSHVNYTTKILAERVYGL